LKLPRIEAVAEKHAADVSMFIVYIQEAHSADGFKMECNSDAGICYMQPKSDKARISIANDFHRDYAPKACSGILIDTISNEIAFTYEARPERLYVLHNGKLVYRGGMGPYQYSPEDCGRFLDGYCSNMRSDSPSYMPS